MGQTATQWLTQGCQRVWTQVPHIQTHHLRCCNKADVFQDPLFQLSPVMPTLTILRPHRTINPEFLDVFLIQPTLPYPQAILNWPPIPYSTILPFSSATCSPEKPTLHLLASRPPPGLPLQNKGAQTQEGGGGANNTNSGPRNALYELPAVLLPA